MTQEEAEKEIPPERRMFFQFGNRTVCFDVIEAYLWITQNPRSVFRGPYGMCALTGAQRVTIENRASVYLADHPEVAAELGIQITTQGLRLVPLPQAPLAEAPFQIVQNPQIAAARQGQLRRLQEEYNNLRTWRTLGGEVDAGLDRLRAIPGQAQELDPTYDVRAHYVEPANLEELRATQMAQLQATRQAQAVQLQNTRQAELASRQAQLAPLQAEYNRLRDITADRDNTANETNRRRELFLQADQIDPNYVFAGHYSPTGPIAQRQAQRLHALQQRFNELLSLTGIRPLTQEEYNELNLFYNRIQEILPTHSVNAEFRRATPPERLTQLTDDLQRRYNDTRLIAATRRLTDDEFRELDRMGDTCKRYLAVD